MIREKMSTGDQKLRILVIEDNPGDVFLLKEMLREQHDFSFSLESFNCLSEGLACLAEGQLDIILLDLSLPDSHGIETFRKLKALDIPMPVIILTGSHDLELPMKALQEGAQDYLIKGTVTSSLLARAITYSLERWSLLHKMHDFNMKLERKVEERTKELSHTLERMTKAMHGTVSAMSKMVEMRDPYTAGHQERVAQLARAIGEELKLSETRLSGLEIAGLLHDVGKINIPAEVLNKPGRLTEIEFQLIKSHSQAGFEILESVDFQWPVAEIVYQHHERLDGSGYPRGLKDGEILLESRILAVADTVEAVASHRPYRHALGMDKALNIVREGKGQLYDSEIVEICIKVIKGKEFSFS